jgi:hypothetical protein
MTPVSPFSLVHNTARYMTPTPDRMPSAAWSVLMTISKVHWYWKMWNKADTYTKSDNFVDLIKGHALNWFIGNNTILRVTAQAIIISKSILACVEQQKALRGSFQEFVYAVKGEYPISTTCKWATQPSTTFFSPSTTNWWHSNMQAVVGRIKHIAMSIFRLGSDFVKLMMCMMDAIEAFSFDPERRSEDVKEIFVNYKYCYKQLVENKVLMIEELNNNGEVIDQILHGIGSSFKVNELVTSLKKPDYAMEALNVVADIGNGWGGRLFKRIAYEAASFLGLSDKVPEELYPSRDIPVTPKKKKSPIRNIEYTQPKKLAYFESGAVPQWCLE